MATDSHSAPSNPQTSSSDEVDARGRPNKRQRIAASDGRTQDPRAAGQGKSAIRAGTKKKNEGVRVSIANALVEWGNYNPSLPSSSTAGEKELCDFLQRLEKVSTFARTSADTTAQLLSELRKSSKLDILAKVQSELPNLLHDDVILLTDAQSLGDALGQPFRVPLLHRATANRPSLAPNTNFGIQELLKHLAADNEAPVSVYDYSISDPTERTRQTTVSELLSCFQSENPCCKALNFLDIANRTRIQFCPSPITLQNITTKLDARIARDIGSIGSDWRPQSAMEFFLASTKNSISSIHVDTGGGVTWILILEGRKIWYFPRHVNSQTIRWLAQAGSQTPENYEDGWAKVELRSGDLLVMPPCFPHAVFTPEPCLAVGGQFYTAGNMGRSIEGLKLQEDYPEISNEDLDDSVYSTIARILNDCGPVTTSFQKSQIVSSQSLFPNPSDPATYDEQSKESLIDNLNSRGVAVPPKAKKRELLELLNKNGSIRLAHTPREHFIEVFQKVCDRFAAHVT